VLIIIYSIDIVGGIKVYVGVGFLMSIGSLWFVLVGYVLWFGVCWMFDFLSVGMMC